MAYVGFKNLVEKHGLSPALAAYIGRKKYGKGAYDEHAAAGKSLRGVKPKKVKRRAY